VNRPDTGTVRVTVTVRITVSVAIGLTGIVPVTGFIAVTFFNGLTPIVTLADIGDQSLTVADSFITVAFARGVGTARSVR
jgi:hypothetical protein